MLLQEARLLDESSATEIRRRTVIGRAYYASFHFLRGHPCSKEFDAPRTSSVHKALMRHLAQDDNPNVVHCARLLGRLRAVRNLADYTLDQSVSQQMVVEALEDAGEIIEELLENFSKADND